MKGHFSLKDLGKLKSFCDIEVGYKNNGICLSHTKYTLDFLEGRKLISCRLVETPIVPGVKYSIHSNLETFDLARYWRLVDKLVYLTVIRHDISYVVGRIS